jgi:HSP20 family protein
MHRARSTIASSGGTEHSAIMDSLAAAARTLLLRGIPEANKEQPMQKSEAVTRTAPQTRDPFQTLFNRLFGDMAPELYGGGEQSLAPRTNIAEHDGAYELSFELPGHDEKDIQVDLHDHVLTVTAERKDTRDEHGKRWHRVEHRYGRFQRAISLPHDATANGIEAVYRQGVLNITVPKAPESRPQKITVKS